MGSTANPFIAVQTICYAMVFGGKWLTASNTIDYMIGQSIETVEAVLRTQIKKTSP
jgi:hypothetical protein